MTRAKILVVEDEAEVAETLKMMLKKFGYNVVGCENRAEDAIQKAGEVTSGYCPDGHRTFGKDGRCTGC